MSKISTGVRVNSPKKKSNNIKQKMRVVKSDKIANRKPELSDEELEKRLQYLEHMEIMTGRF